MASFVSEEELSDEFSMFGVELDKENIVAKLQELCTMHRMNAGDVATEWVAFTHSKKNVNMELEMLEHFERERLSKRHQKTPKPGKKDAAPIRNSIDPLPMDVEGAEELYTAYGGITPKSKPTVANKRQHTPENAPIKRFTGPNRSPAVPFSPASFSPASTTPAKKYNSRTNKGDVVASLGNSSSVQWHGSGQPVSVDLYSTDHALATDFKYMFQKMSDKRDVLNEIIEDLGEQIQQANSIEEYSHVALPTQDEVTIVGRVCCDSQGKINAKSVLLEGSVDMSSGRTVPVDLSQLKEYALFPGQVVALKGHNSTGQKFVASKLYQSTPLPLPETLASPSRMSVMVAAGPFSTSDSLSYEPLTDLLEQIQQMRPDVCILMGPFVDCKNSEIENGKCPVPYDTIFQSKIEEIGNATENLNMQVVILPSYRDLHHDPVYPTPAYRRCNTKHKHLQFMSDPCTLRINNVVIGLTSTDVLFQMGNEEISHPPGGSDRLGRLTHHLLAQHSYYPFYPPTEEMCIDYEKFHPSCMMPVTPHIFITPSEFKQYIKEVDGCCCINPGRLTKGLIGSTYAKISINLGQIQSQQSIHKHITAQVLRI